MSIQDHKQMGRLIAEGGTALSHSSEKRSLGFTSLEWVVVAAIAMFIAMQVILVFVQEINWDEFFFLSQVYDHQRGELTKVLQTIHVHLFGWLPMVSGGEMRQITIARSIMLVFELGTMVSIYTLARVFVSRPAAILSVLAYVSAGFVFLFGTSFRTDPIAACLMMINLAIIARADWNVRNLGFVALLLGIAALVTMKIVFYLPALIALGLWRIGSAVQPTSEFFKIVSCSIGAVFTLAIVYLLHKNSLPPVSGDGSTKTIGSTISAALFGGGIFPTAIDIARGSKMAIAQSLILIGGSVVAVISCVRERNQRSSLITILALATPLLSFLFYSNAYPYFFAFIFPPAMVLFGVAVDRLKFSSVSQMGLIAVMCLPTMLLFGRTLQMDRVAQKDVIEIVHQMFPTPVPYIDRNSMISSFPKRGIFMSTWGLKSYFQKGDPIFGTILKNETVPLLILNSPTLEHAVGEPLSAPLRAALLPEDRALLINNYIAHSGKIWVAGQTHELTGSQKTIKFVIPGHYQIESEQTIEINGVAVEPGALIKFDRASYQIFSPTKQILTFRWGKDLFRPAAEPSDLPIYKGF